MLFSLAGNFHHKIGKVLPCNSLTNTFPSLPVGNINCMVLPPVNDFSIGLISTLSVKDLTSSILPGPNWNQRLTFQQAKSGRGGTKIMGLVASSTLSWTECAGDWMETEGEICAGDGTWSIDVESSLLPGSKFSHWLFLEGNFKQSAHFLPDYLQAQFRHLPLPLHRQHCGMFLLEKSKYLLKADHRASRHIVLQYTCIGCNRPRVIYVYARLLCIHYNTACVDTRMVYTIYG